MNKRRVVIIGILLITGIILGVKHWQNQQHIQKHQPIPRDSIEHLLDNGIQFSKLIKKKQFLDNIKIDNIKIVNQKISFRIKNNSKDSVFLSNQIAVGDKDQITTFFTHDTTDKKIELKPGSEQILEIQNNQSELSQIIGTSISEKNIHILKPIYQKYDSPTLIGIAKYSSGE